ncbi:unnamed protein product, partial [Meganyctiphanes norvegica]
MILLKKQVPNFTPRCYKGFLPYLDFPFLENRKQKQTFPTISEDTASKLHKKLYRVFIFLIRCTCKNINSEAVRASLLLLLSPLATLIDASFFSERGPGSAATEIIEINPQELKEKREKEHRKKLTGLLEKIEGCSHVMEVEERYLVFDGDLVELNQDDYSAMQRVHAYLLNDALMIAAWLSDRRGPVRYRFEVLYGLDQVLPVNIKDRGTTKNAFKVLIFPDTRVFMAPNPKAKQDWLDEIERTKANKVAADKKKTERVHTQQKERQLSLTKEESLEINNPFGAEDEEDENSNPFLEVSNEPAVPETPEWLTELPEELDQAIAQRNFEDAVSLIDQGREYFDSVPKTPSITEMRRLLETRVRHLVEVLQAELRVSPTKSLQGGPKAARRATTLLVHLNKSTQACELFLGHRGAILKSGLKRLRLEGKTVVYVRQLCSIFFHNLLETGREFSKAFPANRNCTSAFVVWAHSEVHNFASMFSRHVFAIQSSLTTVAECISHADHHCQQLSEIGLDLRFSLHTLLLKDVDKWIRDGRDKMIEAVKLRAQEDTWKVLKYDSREQLAKFIDDMNDIGLANIETYIIDDLSVGLTNNSVQFSRAILAYLEDVIRLFWPETENQINDSLTSIFKAQLRHCQASLNEPLFKKEVAVIRRNSGFLLDSVLTVAEHRYAEAAGHAHPTLQKLHSHRTSLTSDTLNIPTISKYESNFL